MKFLLIIGKFLWIRNRLGTSDHRLSEEFGPVPSTENYTNCHDYTLYLCVIII